MGIKNDGKVQRISWFVITDLSYTLAEIADEYNIPNTVYKAEAIGPKEWGTEGGVDAYAVRLSATRREFLDLMKDFKDSYPESNAVVMK